MTDRDILIELLAIKLFEHSPMGDGSPNKQSWMEADPEDRQAYRGQIIAATEVEQLYVVEP